MVPLRPARDRALARQPAARRTRVMISSARAEDPARNRWDHLWQLLRLRPVRENRSALQAGRVSVVQDPVILLVRDYRDPDLKVNPKSMEGRDRCCLRLQLSVVRGRPGRDPVRGGPPSRQIRDMLQGPGTGSRDHRLSQDSIPAVLPRGACLTLHHHPRRNAMRTGNPTRDPGREGRRQSIQKGSPGFLSLHHVKRPDSRSSLRSFSSSGDTGGSRGKISSITTCAGRSMT